MIEYLGNCSSITGSMQSAPWVDLSFSSLKAQAPLLGQSVLIVIGTVSSLSIVALLISHS